MSKGRGTPNVSFLWRRCRRQTAASSTPSPVDNNAGVARHFLFSDRRESTSPFTRRRGIGFHIRMHNRPHFLFLQRLTCTHTRTLFCCAHGHQSRKVKMWISIRGELSREIDFQSYFTDSNLTRREINSLGWLKWFFHLLNWPSTTAMIWTRAAAAQAVALHVLLLLVCDEWPLTCRRQSVSRSSIQATRQKDDPENSLVITSRWPQAYEQYKVLSLLISEAWIASGTTQELNPFVGSDSQSKWPPPQVNNSSSTWISSQVFRIWGLKLIEKEWTSFSEQSGWDSVMKRKGANKGIIYCHPCSWHPAFNPRYIH